MLTGFMFFADVRGQIDTYRQTINLTEDDLKKTKIEIKKVHFINDKYYYLSFITNIDGVIDNLVHMTDLLEWICSHRKNNHKIFLVCNRLADC